MDLKHPSPQELQAFTAGRLDRAQADAIVAHLQQCAACREQQSQMAMAAIFAKMKEIQEHNEPWTCSDPFWGPPYPLAPITPPRSEEEISAWEADHKLRLPAVLARALQTQNGGYVRGTDIVLCPLAEFQLLSEPRWDRVFGFDQIVTERDKLLYIGFEDQMPANIILNYSQTPRTVRPVPLEGRWRRTARGGRRFRRPGRPSLKGRKMQTPSVALAILIE